MDSRLFQQPPTILRPAPFWAINDRISPDECARQMEEMLAAGLSGGFFHSRPGLVTDYLGEEWFAGMKAVLETARKQGGYLWLYDEDCWPSGNAGGQVSASNEEFRAATLQAELIGTGAEIGFPCDTEFRAAYAVRRKGFQLDQVLPLSLAEARTYRGERLLFRRVYARRNFLCWGNESLANLLDPRAVQKFIQCTYDLYARHFGKDFGTHVPAIFTDEPGFQIVDNAFPWYEGMPGLYRRWYDREYWADLPYLFFDGPDCRHIRLLMHRAVLRQFREAFGKRLFEWCEAHGILFTGHYVHETSLLSQLQGHCGGVMAHYRYMHVPGIDQVGADPAGEFLTLKQVSSAARQLGRNRVLTELFGGIRHSCTFETFRWIGDYHLVLGANFFCPHLSWYSLRGRRKRDYPPTWSYQQTYWKELRILADYFTRIGYALTCGHADAPALLLQPMDSAIAGRRLGVAAARNGRNEDTRVAEQCDRELRTILDAVLTTGCDCDLGDEEYLADLGTIENRCLHIGPMSYAVVVVPPSQTWRSTTLDLLRALADAGGKIIFLGETPGEVDGRSDAGAWQDLAGRSEILPCTRTHIQCAMDKAVPRTFIFRDPEQRPLPNTYLQHRIDGEQECFFIVNADRSRPARCVLTLFNATEKSLSLWDPVDGSRTVLSLVKEGQDARYSFTLPAAGSVLLVAEPAPGGGSLSAPPMPDLSYGNVIPMPLSDIWEFERMEENVLVVDRISVSTDGGVTWWANDLDCRVRRRLMKHFGTEGMQECQPWVALRKGWYTGKGGDIILRYHFNSTLAHARGISIVLEHADSGPLKVNGAPVDLDADGWHWDRAFRKVEISGLVQQGGNVVEQHVRYDFLTEVEPLYVVGDFGVRLSADRKSGELIDEPSRLRSGSWIEQGYPFYSGRMLYRSRFDMDMGKGHRVFLRLRQASGTLFSVRLNSRDAGKILWRPHVLELTDLLRPGENVLDIEVISSLQNTFGPLHNRDNEDTSLASFDENNPREEYSLFSYGLLEGAGLVVT